jgi:hypothetical protein
VISPRLSNDVDERMLKSITNALERIGKGVSSVSFWQFKTETGMEPDKIPRNIEKFSEAMSSLSLFGIGYALIQASIISELKKEFEISTLPSGSLQEAVDLIRKKALRNSLTS